ncbi:MAG: FtsX-like permease family protein [Spartobacteria bacterium]|nr:FtsX-like permease family protein [Spartobacteria bacterium]
MTVLTAKLFRDMRQSSGMLLAIVAIIAFGISSYVSMLGAYRNLDQSRARYYSESRMADFWIDLKKAPVDDVRQVLSISGISSIRERISFPVMVDFDGVERPVNALALSLPDIPKPVINNVVMRSGSYFTPDQQNQVIVSEKFAKARNLTPGDRVRVLMDGQMKTLVVVGTAISSEFIYLSQPGSMMDNPGDYGVLFVKRSFAENVFDFSGCCNSIVGLLTPELRSSGAKSIFEHMKFLLKPYGLFSITPLSEQSSNQTLLSEMGGLQTMASFLPVLFLGVAAMVLNVLMTRMAEQQRTIIGTLKALGYTGKEVRGHFRWFGIVVGLTGGVSGSLLGFWLAGGMVAMYQGVFTFPHLYNELFPGLMLTGCLIALVFSVLGSLRGVRLVSLLNPAEAMRQPSPPIGEKTVLERFERFWNALDFRWQMLLRNVCRQKGRTAVAIIAAIAGSSLVLISLGMMNSMDAMITYQFDNVMTGDYTLSFKDAVARDALRFVQNQPGVARAECLFDVAGTFINGNHSKKGVITGVQSDACLTRMFDEQGRLVTVPPYGVAMSAHLAKQLDVKAGDTLTFVPVRGAQKRCSIPVVAIIKSVIGLEVYGNIDWINQLMGESGVLTSVQLQGRLNHEQETAFFQTVKNMPMVQSVASIQSQKRALSTQFNQSMGSMVMVMVIFAGVIFFGAILNGALISIAERKREIATFRVLGYTPVEISQTFLRENLLTNMLGALLGLPVGYWLLVGMMTQFATDAYRFPCVVYPITWFYTLALAVIFVLGAQLIVHRQILKINWQEALSMKE